MIANHRITLVIQGPMVSAGNSGAGTQTQAFDCNTNVQRLIDTTRAVVDGYVLSTWHGQAVTVRDEKLEVLQLQDPGPQQTFFSDAPNNELRQAYGCLEGVRQAIGRFSPDYILRVRTDQYVDIPTLLDHMLQVDELFDDFRASGQSGFLFFPNMLSWSPYSVGDFFIGGHASDMLRFFDSQVRYSKHSLVNAKPWVHSDIILRHAYGNLRGKLDVPEDRYFPNLVPAFRLDLHAPPSNFKYHPEMLSLWRELLNHSISLFPRAATDKLEWRGARFETGRHSAGEFYQEWLEARKDVEAWMRKMQPNLYSTDHQLGTLNHFLNFCPEKALELQVGHPTRRRYLYQGARTVFSLLTGKMPRDEWAVRLWLRWQRLLTHSRRRNT
ncbi:WavE lipopolysaccharide synthesis family protein [Rhodoferax mekongensis]|uniref:WavE lipopolysaccharide synthesis family protein n=1 Tax=Rhodoferax mekongensis TaxID=3068341 RepID=A0ABZ0AVS7_9BURK|nr:WavE lipopolysaccharide synthesis family protein [Rhodoferax sp. TBRC 17307]WNO03716.1 WavE lipopolysaccharide synthesis family protein [Rhodoferax sp. TBRC 17307]